MYSYTFYIPCDVDSRNLRKNFILIKTYNHMAAGHKENELFTLVGGASGVGDWCGGT